MQKQRKLDELYVKQAVNNMGYIYKDQVRQHIIKFLQNQTSFRPFDAVRNRNNTIISFIQLRGFIEIGQNHYHEMIIGIPQNYPQGPPIFLLSINRALFKINKEQQMIMNKQILLEMDDKGMEFIRFNFPFLSHGWIPMTSLIDIYKQFQKVVSSPPILVDLPKVKQYNEWEQLNQQSRGIKNNHALKEQKKAGNMPELTDFIDSKSIELSNMFSTLNQLQENEQHLTYQHSRNHYLLNQHLKQLEKNLTKKSQQISEKSQQVNEAHSKALQKNVCDEFLIISQKDLIKLQNLAERQALKQAQKKVKEMLQRELENGKKYSENKKIVRTLFSHMYENQTKILQSAE